MSVTLKWDGDELKLGKTKMAEVFTSMKAGAVGHFYIIGPGDKVSERYESKDDCRQDCERHVRELLVKAGALS